MIIDFYNYAGRNDTINKTLQDAHEDRGGETPDASLFPLLKGYMEGLRGKRADETWAKKWVMDRYGFGIIG